MRRLTTFLLAVLLTFAATHAQSQDAPLQALLQQHAGDVAKPSRRTVDAIVEALLAAELPGVSDFLVRWRDKEVWHHGESGLFYYVKEQADDLTLIDIDTGKEAGTAAKRDLAQIRPNSGVRSGISVCGCGNAFSFPTLTPPSGWKHWWRSNATRTPRSSNCQ
ncbi:MAG: hypothetical protein M9908_07905 [Phyllobacteriaceae bacterium]|nr:hypothetical protein [Phyllobacteriaceae bacterium]